MADDDEDDDEEEDEEDDKTTGTKSKPASTIPTSGPTQEAPAEKLAEDVDKLKIKDQEAAEPKQATVSNED